MRLLPCLLSLIPLSAALPEDLPRYEIPFSEKAGGQELSLPLVWDRANLGKPIEDLEATLRLSWNAEALHLGLTIVDDQIQPAAEGQPIGSGDAFDIVLGPKPGERPWFRAQIALSGEPEKARLEIEDTRSDKSQPLSMEARATRTAGGYLIEARLHWKALGLSPAEGEELALNAAMIDFDGTAPKYTARWQGNEDPNALRTFRLVKKPAWKPTLAGKIDLGYLNGIAVSVVGDASLAGTKVDVRDDHGDIVGNITLREERGRSYGRTLLPIPASSKTAPRFDLLIKGKRSAIVEGSTPLDLRREKLLAKSQIVADPAVFGDETFPKINFAEPAQAANCLGNYQIRTRFFDAQYNEVTKATSPGRYGAVVEIEGEDGRKRTRFLTLYRTPGRTRWHDWSLELEARFSKEYGWQVSEEQKEGFEYFFKQRLATAGLSGSALPAMIAALAEGKAEDYQNADARWWIGLKRKLGYYPAAPEKISWEPRIAAEPKPELREGSEAEAGFQSGARDRLAALCKKWADESKEPFAVCVARKGVLLMNQGFGERDGKPISVNSPSWMASISKLVGAITIIRLVEQGKIALDAPASRYLPLLGDSPVTVRQILLHESGAGHIEHNWARAWSEPLQDIDAMVGAALPAAPKNPSFFYSNADFDLSGRIVESVTGEPCNIASLHAIFEPLGCKYSYLYDYAGRRSFGTALDYARIGQMLLNGGTYGNMEFLKPQSVADMSPKGIPRGGNRPIGLGYDEGTIAGYSGEVIGHGAASGAIFRFFPKEEIVLVITRNTFGGDHGKHSKAFVEALMTELRN